MHIKTVSLTCT